MITYKEFRDFLRRHDCEPEFDSCFHAFCGANRFDAFLADYMVLDEAFFGRVFRWDLTPQGRPFWKNIDDLWMKYCLGREGQ